MKIRICRRVNCSYAEQHEEIREFVSYFIAPPTISLHSTGGSVDALICDLKIIVGWILERMMPKSLTWVISVIHNQPLISSEAKKNRRLLIDLFEKEDFMVDIKEYRHFDYANIGWAIEKGENFSFYGMITRPTPI